MTGWMPLRVAAHRASSATLAGAYPFLAALPPTEGVYVGVDAFSGAPFCFDPWTLYAAGALTNPNVLLAGVIGQGKSALAKSLAVRSVAVGRRVYVPGDPKGEWGAVAEAVGGTVLRLGPGRHERLNPLDSSSVDVQGGSTAAGARHRLLASLAETSLRRPLRPAEHTVLDDAIQRVGRRRVPVLPDVVASLASLSDGSTQGDDLTHAVRRLVKGDLAGLFDGPTTVRLDPDSPMVVIDLSGLGAHDEALGVAMTCAAGWLEGVLRSHGGFRWVIYDEAWRLMRSLPLVQRMQAQWKLSRAFGIANLIVVHRLSDLNAVGDERSEIREVTRGLLADCSTRILYRQETDQLTSVTAAVGLTEPERHLLPQLPRGTGLWKLGRHSHVVHHLLHHEEARVFDTDAAMREGPR
jgi:type IV secretory pathway VirB4 component